MALGIRTTRIIDIRENYLLWTPNFLTVEFYIKKYVNVETAVATPLSEITLKCIICQYY